MIELREDSLAFSFAEVHPSARLRISFQRTLRIPDDGRDYPLPPGLGRFPLRHVDDFPGRVPPSWIEHGGVMLPMYQAEAMWLGFDAGYDSDREAAYPFAVKIATGKVNAVSGSPWCAGLSQWPQQDYVVMPRQPWLDGYCVEKGVIRQFVAMPLGAGYTAEEQVTGEAEHGGLQIVAYPMKRHVFERRFPVKLRTGIVCSRIATCDEITSAPCMDMGLAPGGRMRQEIYDDPFDLDDWDLEQGSRCFVHIANSLVWRSITGTNPPTKPPTAAEYTRVGLPWFDWYDDHSAAIPGSGVLAGLKSVVRMGREKREAPLPENESVMIDRVRTLNVASKQLQDSEL